VATFALKLLLAPAFVVGASLCVRRWGPRIGGTIGGLPVIAGPILLVLAVTHTHRFTATAADAILLGLVSLTAFALVYAWGCARLRWWQLLPIAWGAFLGATAVFNQVSVSVPVGFCLACLALTAALQLIPSRASGTPLLSMPRWDLPLRAVCAAAMVTALTGVSGSLGAHLSGLLAAFPIITSILAAFTQAHSGALDTRRLLHGMVRGFFAYATFCAVVAATIRPLGTAPAFLIATPATLLVGVLTLWHGSRASRAG